LPDEDTMAAFVASMDGSGSVRTGNQIRRDDSLKGDNHFDSRGLSVHELGHVMLCGLLFDRAATNVMVAYTDARTTCTGTKVLCSGIDCTCKGSPALPSTCIEENYARSSSSFNDNVGLLAGLLHDGFDGHQSRRTSDQPGDGDPWFRIPFSTRLEFSPAGYGDNGDEDVVMPGTCIRTVIDKWDDHGELLRESSFLQGFADAMGSPSCGAHSWCQQCHLFAIHQQGRSPDASYLDDFRVCEADSKLRGWLGSPPASVEKLQYASCSACPPGQETTDGQTCAAKVCPATRPFRLYTSADDFDCVASCPSPLFPDSTGRCILVIL